MATAQKYLFDVSFDAPVRPVAPTPPPPPPEPTFSREELVAAEAKGRAEGHAAGHAEAVSAHEEQVGKTLAQINDSLAALLAAKDAMMRDGERETVELTRGIIGKLFPTLQKSDGLGEITALVGACLRESVAEPRLVVRVPDALFEKAQQRLAPMTAATGFPGKLIILADEALAGSDCRVEWADGGAERDLTRTWRDIEAAMIRAVDRPAAKAGATPDTNPQGDTKPQAASGETQEKTDG
jgi:flagellar assembly protein FliH